MPLTIRTEQEKQEYDASKPFRAGQGEELYNDEGQAENEPDLVAFVIEQRAHALRGDEEAERLREGDTSILSRGEPEAIRQCGQVGSQYGGDHPVDEDGEDRGEDQYASGFPFNMFVTNAQVGVT